MANPFPGYVAPAQTEPTRFQMDAGVLTIGGIALAYVHGPSKGGWSFDSGEIYRVVEADGIMTETVGLRRIVGYDTHIKGKVMLASAAALGRYMPGSSSDGSTGSTGNTLTPKPSRVLFAANDYMQGIYLHGNLSDNTTARIHGAYGIVVKWPFSWDDNNEGLFDVDIKLVNPSAAPNIAPFDVQLAG